MSELAGIIREMIASEGPMPLDRYMQLALGHPVHGYYITRDPFGAAGDFVTAPEISQMFGELCGLWAAEVWASMGAPARLHLVELGPGRGTLMADALRASRVAKPFADALDVHLVETSPVLRARQRETLGEFGTSGSMPISWHERIEDVPDGPAIFIANEFFDALPVRHFVRTPRGWCERLVGLGERGELVAGLADEPDVSIRGDAPVGSVVEIGVAGYRLMADLAARLVRQGGAALVIDYGHTQTATGETLQALKAHGAVDPLAEPGEADITAHVDFAALARAARAAGAQVAGPVQQADFLSTLGIFERAAGLKRKATPRQALDIDRSLMRLVGTGREMGVGGGMVPGMGALFKVIAVTSPGLPMPPGFATGGV